MASIQIVDSPKEARFYSVYSPIKYTIRVSGSNTNGQLGTVKDYVSLRVHFTPYNETTDQWMNGSSVSSAGNNPLPDETFAIRVQFTPFVYGWSVDETPNDGTYRYFSIDVSSLLRNQLSYNLRPCSHDTLNDKIKRDITLNQIATNLHSYFQIAFTPEYINSSGVLVEDSDLKEYRYIRPINTALTYEEEINGYISDQIVDEDDTYPSLVQHSVIENIYTHKPNVNENYYAKKKYLSVKPRHRYIGVDECEYLTFAARRDDSNDGVYVVITFYDSNGNTIDNGQTSGYYGVNINATANGDGTNSSHKSLFTYGDGGNNYPYYAVMQVGVGTRNIKELAMQDGTRSKFRNSQPISDFSNVAYYTVSTHLNVSPFSQIGETITYYIDHERTNYKDNVRFHWQSRLGGIDSYTFDGGMTRGIETSSSTYEQTIYPQFRGQLGSSANTNNLFIGDHDWQTAASQNGGAFIARRSGLTDDQYPAIRKHQVDAFGNGTAVSKPLDRAEMGMIEDLMASPNVWVERGWIGRELFKEDFSYSSTSDISDNWNIIEGDFTTDGELFTDEGHTAGTKTYRKGNNSGDDELNAYSKSKFAYDPNKIYEFEIRYKSSDGADDLIYCGFTGWAKDKVTKINTSGSDAFSSQHYVCLSSTATSSDDDWRIARGYVSGYMRDSGQSGGDRPDPMNHARAYQGVKYFSPQFIVNHNNEEGRTFVDYVKVTEYQGGEETHAKVWSSLNKHYYVPALIKDGSKQLYNSEELTTISLDYVESRKKRGIRN
jgi:hypothetical protein